MSKFNSILIPARVNDLTGRVFHRLSVVAFIRVEKGHALWLCKCVCGAIKNISARHLIDGTTKSCGCLNNEISPTANLHHGHSKNGNLSTTYRTWQAMIARCTRHSVNSYKDYGGRGISVCEKWKRFEGFIADMGDRPTGHQIDRIDVNGNYEPSNCRWVSAQENGRNRRNNNRVTFNGKTKTMVEWAEEINVPEDTLWHRLYTSKWSIEKSLTTPLRKKTSCRQQ